MELSLKYLDSGNKVSSLERVNLMILKYVLNVDGFINSILLLFILKPNVK